MKNLRVTGGGIIELTRVVEDATHCGYGIFSD